MNNFLFFSCSRLLILLSLMMGGCSSDQKSLEDQPADKLYNKALEELKKDDFMKAAKAFDQVEQYHPYSQWATRSQIMSSYCYYKARAYERALEQLENFIQFHPGHPDIPYAYYLKSYCFYHQISIVERDQKMTELALEALNEIMRRYPESPYAKDAKLKVQLTKDHLAGKNMDIGRFYQKKKFYIAAINRFKTVTENYQQTTHTSEALYRLTECYIALGLFVEAKKAASVLGYNYPHSDWYAETYQLINSIDPALFKQEIKSLPTSSSHAPSLLQHKIPSYTKGKETEFEKLQKEDEAGMPALNRATIAEAPPYEQRPVAEIKPDDASKGDIPVAA